jgi:hypothetical protein
MKPWILLLAALLLAGCTGSSVDFSIDNPADVPLRLQIDGISYDIPAHQAQDITLKAGEHHMEALATGKISFIVYADRKGGLINASLSDYVIVNQVYVTDASKLKNFGAIQATLRFDGVEFEGPFVLANGLFIDNAWRFGVREPFPQTLQGYDPGNGGNIFSKIFTEKDFIAYYEQQAGQPGYYEKNRQHAAPTPRQLAQAPVLPTFADPQIQNASLKLRDLYQRYLHATDPAEQKALQKEYFQLSMDYTSFVASKAYQQPVAENEKQNVFTRLIGNAMGVSARVVN